MSEQRQRVEAEAREWSQAELWICRDCERGFIAGRTVTDEQVEKAAEGMWNRHGTPGLFPYAPEHMRMAFLRDTRAALTAAGFLIEGDDHE